MAYKTDWFQSLPLVRYGECLLNATGARMGFPRIGLFPDSIPIVKQKRCKMIRKTDENCNEQKIKRNCVSIIKQRGVSDSNLMVKQAR
jgi:hypothetical protein